MNTTINTDLAFRLGQLEPENNNFYRNNDFYKLGISFRKHEFETPLISAFCEEFVDIARDYFITYFNTPYEETFHRIGSGDYTAIDDIFLTLQTLKPKLKWYEKEKMERFDKAAEIMRKVTIEETASHYAFKIFDSYCNNPLKLAHTGCKVYPLLSPIITCVDAENALKTARKLQEVHRGHTLDIIKFYSSQLEKSLELWNSLYGNQKL